MSLTAEGLLELRASRWNETYIGQEWENREQRFNEWKARIQALDAMYRGDWTMVFPDETAAATRPHVQNLVRDALHDLANLVAENTPSVRVDPMGDSDAAKSNAALKQAVYNTYWGVRASEVMVPTLAMDLAGTGTCFVLSYAKPGEAYPCHRRLDPRNCYPDIDSDSLQDLLHVTKMKLRKAARAFPELGIPIPEPRNDEDVEVIDYFSPQQVMRVVYHKRPNTSAAVYPVFDVANQIGITPVGWDVLESFDGGYRGLFDQLPSVLLTQNRIAMLILDNADQMVYAPWFSRGNVQNPEEVGPGAVIEGDADADYRRLQPSQVSPELFTLMALLGSAAHPMASSPDAREGNVRQSIASASFVQSTMGKLTSVVLNVERHLATMRRRLNEIDAKVDRAYSDSQKALMIPVGATKTFTPSRVFGDDNYFSRVEYGVGAGLDKLQASSMLHQDLAANLTSRRTARENMTYILDPEGEEVQWQRERMAEIIFETAAARADLPSLIQMASLLSQGQNIIEASRVLTEAAQQVPQAPGPAPMGGTAAQQQGALQAGGIPGQAPQLAGPTAPGAAEPLSRLAPPPLEQVLVRG